MSRKACSHMLIGIYGQDFVDIYQSTVLLVRVRFLVRTLVSITDGSSAHGAHIRNKSDISICWRHLVTSPASSNLIFTRFLPILNFMRAQHFLGYHLLKGKLKVKWVSFSGEKYRI